MANVVNSLRIVIADDHELFRHGVRVLLQSHAGWEICGEGKTGREALVLTRELIPDIVILDIAMPDLNGVEAARRIRQTSKDIEVLILSVHYSDQLIREIVDAGVSGYMLKSDPEYDLLVAVETLARHKPFFTCRARQAIQNTFKTNERKIPTPLRKRLTSREREILQLLAEGKTCKEAAAHLGISFKTADTHRSNMMNKLEMHNICELVRYAVREQIIEP
jgi:DNA-binding NarL/FixJ family response regulator